MSEENCSQQEHSFIQDLQYGIPPTTSNFMGRDSSVGVVTRYGSVGPGIESRWGRDFPRPALGPTYPPAQRVPGLFPGVKATGAWAPRLKEQPLLGFTVCSRVDFTFTVSHKFYKAYNCSVALCGDLPKRVSPKSVKKYGKYIYCLKISMTVPILTKLRIALQLL